MATTPADPVVGLLLKAPLTPTQRRAASEAFTSSANEDELAQKLGTMKLPKFVSADLWDLKAAQRPQPSSEPPQPEGSAVGRFATNLGEQINPVALAKGVVNTALHPIDTAGAILSAANDQRLKAHEEMDRGNYGQMAARSVAAAIPVLGPAAAEAGEQGRDGDVAGMLGKAVGLVGPMLAFGAARKAPANAAVKANAMEREAANTVAQKVLSPANPKYKAPAQRVAPKLLERGVQGDRIAVQQWADDLAHEAQQRIDDVIASYPATDRLPTATTLAALDDAMSQLKFPGPNGASQVNPALQGAYDALANQRKFVADLGPDMSFADMRRLRQQLDDLAQKAGAFSKANGDLSLSAVEDAALKTSNAVREQIAQSRPELAAPHADMNLALTVRDILDPAKGRPTKPPSATTGATGGLHTTGAIIGSAASSVPIVKSIAAFVASEVIPKLREAKVSPQNQLRLANDQYKLAQALKAGQASTAQKLLLNMSMYVPGFSGIGRITEPAGAPR